MCFGGAAGAIPQDGQMGVVMVDPMVMCGAVGVFEDGDAEPDVAVVGLRGVGCRWHREMEEDRAVI